LTKLQFVRNKYAGDNACSIVPTSKIKNENVELMQQHYRDLVSSGLPTNDHSSKCPGLNLLNKTGWVVLSGPKTNNFTLSFPPEKYTRYFPQWRNKYLYKISTLWMMYVPEGKLLLTIPIQNNSSDSWFAVSGVLAKEHGPTHFSIFLLSSDSNLTLQPNTPLAQLLIVDRSDQVEFRESNVGDDNNFLKKEDLLHNGTYSLKAVKSINWQNVDG